MGDEAGGGLAYALAVLLDSRSALPPARSVILFTPWLDIHLPNPAIHNLEHFDPINRLQGLTKQVEYLQDYQTF